MRLLLIAFLVVTGLAACTSSTASPSPAPSSAMVAGATLWCSNNAHGYQIIDAYRVLGLSVDPTIAWDSSEAGYRYAPWYDHTELGADISYQDPPSLAKTLELLRSTAIVVPTYKVGDQTFQDHSAVLYAWRQLSPDTFNASCEEAFAAYR